MRRKRKNADDEEKENKTNMTNPEMCEAMNMKFIRLINIMMPHIQQGETFHKKYIKELKQVYSNMDHEMFFLTFIKIVKVAVLADEANENAQNLMIFCAKFVASFNTEATHQILADTFKWVLSTVSNVQNIRLRLCQFVNMILNAMGKEASLDDYICDQISDYMLSHLRDNVPNVRVQAIIALQRLQVPDDMRDRVLKAYIFHLTTDPSARVRQSVITCMGRNQITIPYVLERLWDIDDKVRRHTYLHISSYPVRSYKVSQRLIILEQGLNDRFEPIRKVVVTVLLKQWLDSYDGNIISLIGALKIDSTENEMERFKKIAQQMLHVIFSSKKKEELISHLPLEEDGDFYRCVPHEKLSIETAIYWQTLVEYLQEDASEDLVVPELSAFCSYVEKFCQATKTDMDVFERLDFQYKLLSLVQILYNFDLGDEIGRENLQQLVSLLLNNFDVGEKIIAVLVKCIENILTDQHARFQFFTEIVQNICNLNAKQNPLVHDRALITELLANSVDSDLNLKLSSLKVKILDLEEQEMNYWQQKDFEKGHQLNEMKNAATEEYTNLLTPLLAKHPNKMTLSLPSKAVKTRTILKCLYITYYMVVSEKVQFINPSVCKLYNDFICRHFTSKQIEVRNMALKCATAFSMLYEAIANEVFTELYSQFSKNQNTHIWDVTIRCIFELLHRYGLDSFSEEGQETKTKTNARLLYPTLEFIDEEESHASSMSGGTTSVGVLVLMADCLDKCENVSIMKRIISGFCRLILCGYIKTSDVVERLILIYFNPVTDPEINQILSAFLENLLRRKMQSILEPCLLPTIHKMLECGCESPLRDIRPETIMRFIIDATKQDTPIHGEVLHNKMAKSFLQDMLDNVGNKELAKILTKELNNLHLILTQNDALKTDLLLDIEKLIKSDLDPRCIKLIVEFKNKLNGNLIEPSRINSRLTEVNEDSEEDDAAVTSEEINCNGNEGITESVNNLYSASESENVPEEYKSTLITPPVVSSNESTSRVLTQFDELSDDSENVSSVGESLLKTTYGRENAVTHSNLRKSLNKSRNQSTCTDDDGPSQPPKIRIEARIDSDKKTSDQTQTRINQDTSSRRTLRYEAETSKNSTWNRASLRKKKNPNENQNLTQITTRSNVSRVPSVQSVIQSSHSEQTQANTLASSKPKPKPKLANDNNSSVTVELQKRQLRSVHNKHKQTSKISKTQSLRQSDNASLSRKRGAICNSGAKRSGTPELDELRLTVKSSKTKRPCVSSTIVTRLQSRDTSKAEQQIHKNPTGTQPNKEKRIAPREKHRKNLNPLTRELCIRMEKIKKY